LKNARQQNIAIYRDQKIYARVVNILLLPKNMARKLPPIGDEGVSRSGVRGAGWLVVWWSGGLVVLSMGSRNQGWYIDFH